VDGRRLVISQFGFGKIALLQTELMTQTNSEAALLVGAVHRIRRLVRQRIRAEWGSPPLPEAQLELVRLLRERPGLRVQEAADVLRVAPNTVSTLAGQLETAGLLERRTDAADRRAIHLRLTPAARARIARWRDRRYAIVEAALSELTEADRAAIAAALPALDRLAERLEP
jgi:DNA-binding MarR family transcriptional regulator